MARKLGGGGGTALVVREGRDSFKRVFKKSEMLNKAHKFLRRGMLRFILLEGGREARKDNIPFYSLLAGAARAAGPGFEKARKVAHIKTDANGVSQLKFYKTNMDGWRGVRAIRKRSREFYCPPSSCV